MSQHDALIEKFYHAFSSKDYKRMTECYHKELVFQDPVFGPLNYEETCAMWKMLIKAGSDLKIYFDKVDSNAQQGSVNWIAVYSFSKTGRKVQNKISAQFRFKDGLIVSHHDHFDLYKWTRMAFGPIGYSLGWTPYFQNKLRTQARGNLDKFMTKS
ncbi:nuclear transport factor 2 family protein [Reichenbachiella agarivorans]|uniref:Nuclear transport factor 2 family protein n=1 Tax=Reichenbachiella agarivorans TaxID=2979464 RepID=A0ABY6CJF0_9BACT|nr:nuclear transport factor 2 family protein [Reichenbachiella agarivorans]UXP30648.1 nuclear transport factor 2 family protein [Reichenbachiella agarivorans]